MWSPTFFKLCNKSFYFISCSSNPNSENVWAHVISLPVRLLALELNRSHRGRKLFITDTVAGGADRGKLYC